MGKGGWGWMDDKTITGEEGKDSEARILELYI